VASDLVTAAAAELYGADPQEFTGRRNALAAEARAAGDAAAARQIAALRKPTRAAWVLNRLARAAPDAPARLAGLATAMRDAQRAKDGRRLRELSARRGELIDDLTGRALAAAGLPDPPAGLREDVATTLTAALADPEVAGQFASGTLTRAAQWAGFGAPPPAPTTPGEPAAAPLEEAAPLAEETRRIAPARKPRTAEDEEKRAARQRKAIEDAERTLATAAASAADAGAAEEQLEAKVRDLEQRLTQARAQLADARLRARRAEAAERKARQALGHLLG
jgi:hypothetical protein